METKKSEIIRNLSKQNEPVEIFDPSKPYDLNLRIRQYILEIFDFVEKLPNKPAAWNIRKQIVRSISSVGANYRAAKRARSDKEYIAKLGIAEEEADETIFWLELIRDAKWDLEAEAQLHLQEANEITAIIVTLLRKAKNKESQRKESP